MDVEGPLQYNNFYRPRSRGDNTFGSVRPSVRLSVRPSVPTLTREHNITTLLKVSVDHLYRCMGVQTVVVSTCWTFAVDHAFNLLECLRLYPEAIP